MSDNSPFKKNHMQNNENGGGQGSRLFCLQYVAVHEGYYLVRAYTMG
jgi:hypothetical protein